MDFALCPEHGYNRITRYVEDGVLPPNVVSTLDPVQNVLLVSRTLFDKLPSDLHKLIVLHTYKKCLVVDRHGNPAAAN